MLLSGWAASLMTSNLIIIRSTSQDLETTKIFLLTLFLRWSSDLERELISKQKNKSLSQAQINIRPILQEFCLLHLSLVLEHHNDQVNPSWPWNLQDLVNTWPKLSQARKVPSSRWLTNWDLSHIERSKSTSQALETIAQKSALRSIENLPGRLVQRFVGT